MEQRPYILVLIIFSLIFFTSCSHDETSYIDEYNDDFSFGLQVFDMSMEMLPNAIDKYSNSNFAV